MLKFLKKNQLKKSDKQRKFKLKKESGNVNSALSSNQFDGTNADVVGGKVRYFTECIKTFIKS